MVSEQDLSEGKSCSETNATDKLPLGMTRPAMVRNRNMSTAYFPADRIEIRNCKKIPVVVGGIGLVILKHEGDGFLLVDSEQETLYTALIDKQRHWFICGCYSCSEEFLEREKDAIAHICRSHKIRRVVTRNFNAFSKKHEIEFQDIEYHSWAVNPSRESC